jgi:CheY-like chemotaxis protein
MSAPLQGLSILVVEDEPIIAMDIAKTFESTGAEMTTTNTLACPLLAQIRRMAALPGTSAFGGRSAVGGLPVDR